MAYGSGSTYSTTLSVSGDPLTTAGTLAYYVLAKDASSGGVSSRTPTGTKSIGIKACNLAPTFYNDDNQSPLYVPLTGGSCPAGIPTTISLYITVSDIDDAVVGVTFWYKPYLSTKWFSAPPLVRLTQGNPSTWNGTLSNAKFPKLPKAGQYQAQWYVKMTDAGGVTGTSPVMSMIEESC